MMRIAEERSGETLPRSKRTEDGVVVMRTMGKAVGHDAREDV
jgi:hypothetical protein